jgi:hypothetical protein
MCDQCGAVTFATQEPGLMNKTFMPEGWRTSIDSATDSTRHACPTCTAKADRGPDATETVKKLRAVTGAAIEDCWSAMARSGSYDKALAILMEGSGL